MSALIADVETQARDGKVRLTPAKYRALHAEAKAAGWLCLDAEWDDLRPGEVMVWRGVPIKVTE